MISDLSPGDRMSLKGKLFELQKRLTIMDIEERRDQQFSYRPQIIDYELPNRQHSFLENSEKAEVIRRQRKKLLAETIVHQSEENCTFKPKIYTSQKRVAPSNDSRPVHVRLSEQARVYNELHEKRREWYEKHDVNGRKLFTPKIRRHPSHAHTSQPVTDVSFISTAPLATDLNDTSESTGAAEWSDLGGYDNTLSADQFLYQDAKNREVRLQNLIHSYEEAIQSEANAPKINRTSESLLRRKKEREACTLVNLLQPCEEELIGYEDVVRLFESSKINEQYSEEQQLRFVQLFWDVLDYMKEGEVSRDDAIHTIYIFLHHSSPSSAVQALHIHFAPRVQEMQSTCAGLSFAGMKERGLSVFRDQLSKLVKCSLHVKKESEKIPTGTAENESHRSVIRSATTKGSAVTSASKVLDTDSTNFTPKICRQSYKLAQRKERRDLEQLAAVSNVAVNVSVEDGRLLPRPTGKDSVTGETDSVIFYNENKHLLEENSFAEEYPDNDSVLGTESIQDQSIAGGSVAGSVMSINNHRDLMIARSVLTKKKVEQIRQEQSAREMAECTFRPQIIKGNRPTARKAVLRRLAAQAEKSQVSTEDQVESEVTEETQPVLESEELQEFDNDATEQDNRPVHERLYALRERNRQHPDVLPSDFQELQNCTFRPKVNGVPSYLRSPAPDLEKTSKGYGKAVDRMRTVVHERQAKIEAEENAWLHTHEKWQRNRELLIKNGPVPFNFESEERIKKSQMKLPEDDSEDLVINVKLSVNRMAKIRIRKGDHPAEITDRFSKIYGLDVQAKQILYAVILNSMESKGMEIPEDEPEVESSPPPPPPPVLVDDNESVFEDESFSHDEEFYTPEDIGYNMGDNEDDFEHNNNPSGVYLSTESDEGDDVSSHGDVADTQSGLDEYLSYAPPPSYMNQVHDTTIDV